MNYSTSKRINTQLNIYIDSETRPLYFIGMDLPNDLITTTEARKLLNVGTHKMRALIGDKMLRVFINPLDKRKKLVSRAEVLALKVPRAA